MSQYFDCLSGTPFGKDVSAVDKINNTCRPIDQYQSVAIEQQKRGMDDIWIIKIISGTTTFVDRKEYPTQSVAKDVSDEYISFITKCMSSAPLPS